MSAVKYILNICITGLLEWLEATVVVISAKVELKRFQKIPDYISRVHGYRMII